MKEKKRDIQSSNNSKESENYEDDFAVDNWLQRQILSIENLSK